MIKKRIDQLGFTCLNNILTSSHVIPGDSFFWLKFWRKPGNSTSQTINFHLVSNHLWKPCSLGSSNIPYYPWHNKFRRKHLEFNIILTKEEHLPILLQRQQTLLDVILDDNQSCEVWGLEQFNSLDTDTTPILNICP